MIYEIPNSIATVKGLNSGVISKVVLNRTVVVDSD